jgi:hypothetical protein
MRKLNQSELRRLLRNEGQDEWEDVATGVPTPLEGDDGEEGVDESEESCSRARA